MMWYTQTVMAPVTRHTQADVKLIAENQHAILHIDLPDRVPTYFKISFDCSCGELSEKTLKAILCTGMKCPACSLQVSRDKRLLASQYEPDLTASTFVLLVDGVEYKDVTLRDTIPLTVAQEYLSNAVIGPYEVEKQRKLHYVAVYWSVQQCKRVRQRVYVEGNDKEGAAMRAKSLLDQVEPVPSPYTVYRTVRDILMQKLFYTKHFRMVKPSLDFEEQTVPLPAYLLASWLGDGTNTKPEITSVDEEIIGYWRKWASEAGMLLTRGTSISYLVSAPPSLPRRSGNILTRALRELNIMSQVKHIPDIYKHNSRAVRLDLLAGLIDTDGSLNGNGYDVVQCLAHEKLFDDFREVAQSLGFIMTKTYCTKSSVHKGIKREFPAVRGNLIGEFLTDIPVLLARKKVTTSENVRRHDRMTFDVLVKE